jgi:uracil-DNA glycosylase
MAEYSDPDRPRPDLLWIGPTDFPNPKHRPPKTMPDTLPFVDYEMPSKAPGGALIAILGEAPGNEEVRQDKPFAGRSGQLLNANLEGAGLERATCLVANTFRRQPPGNKVGHFFASRTRARKEGFEVDESWGPFGTSDYVRAEFVPELEHLRATLERLQPAVILALGRTPTWALTGQNGIMGLRGQVLPCRLLDDAKVVPTLHPSYILRGQRRDEPLFLADIRLAKELAGR